MPFGMASWEPVADALVLQALGGEASRRYGRFRLWTSVGWAATALAGGVLYAVGGPTAILVPFVVGSLLLVVVTARPRHGRSWRRSGSAGAGPTAAAAAGASAGARGGAGAVPLLVATFLEWIVNGASGGFTALLITDLGGGAVLIGRRVGHPCDHRGAAVPGHRLDERTARACAACTSWGCSWRAPSRSSSRSSRSPSSSPSSTASVACRTCCATRRWCSSWAPCCPMRSGRPASRWHASWVAGWRPSSRGRSRASSTATWVAPRCSCCAPVSWPWPRPSRGGGCAARRSHRTRVRLPESRRAGDTGRSQRGTLPPPGGHSGCCTTDETGPQGRPGARRRRSVRAWACSRSEHDDRPSGGRDSGARRS